MKLLRTFLVIVGLLLIGVIPTAAVPYDSYTYDYWNEIVSAPHAYVPEQVIYADDVGLQNFRTPHDIFVAPDNHIYLADTGNNRIIKFDSEWNVIAIVDSFDNQGTQDKFNVPRGIYVTGNGDLHVADRENQRIIILDKDFNLKLEITSPQETQPELFTSDFRFRPDKIGVDSFGTIYVISMGVYDGIMEFDNLGNYQGFVGAPSVNPTLADYVWRVIGTDAQRQRMRLFLPVEHSNIDVDNRGFIYATAIGGDISPEEKIRRLNTAGVDRLMRSQTSPPVGDFPEDVSVFVDVIPRENDIYTVLDRTNGRIFTYNAGGDLLYAFGAIGDVDGAFRNPVALGELDGKLLVVDAIKNSITIFKPTVYKDLIHSAIAAYSSGYYDEATELWHEVLKHNANFDLAYNGIGDALLMKGDFDDAMANFKLANDREKFSEAYKYHRKQVTEQYFGIFAIVIVAFVIYVLFFATSKKSEQSVAESKAEIAATYDAVKTWEEMEKRSLKINLKRIWHGLKFALKIPVSPIQGYWDLKNEKRGNLPTAIILVVLLLLSYLVMYQYTGFPFNERDPRTINILSESISILIPIFLWVTINWSLTTLMNGKGTFKDIFIATAYAFVPLILVLAPLTIASNYLTLDEGAFYYLIFAIAMVWSVALLFLGSMVIHDYSLGSAVGVTILIMVGIGITLFIALLFVDIVLQLFAFVGEVYREFVFRL